MMNKMMTLTAVAAFALVAGNVQAQSSQYGTVEDFYQANPDVDNGQYASRNVNPGYWLVNWSGWSEIDSRWTGGGYVRLGVSNWECHNPNGGGVPLKDWAIAYAKAIGADVVVYACQRKTTNQDDYTCEHLVGFYAKQSVQQVTAASNGRRPTSAEATAAMNRLQDALGKPRVTSGVWYDSKNDTYNWVGPKFHRSMSETASQFLGDVALYL
jgi:hypothetical protein